MSLTYPQQTFGNQHSWGEKKMRFLVTNPEGSITLKPFDDQHNKLALIASLFPEIVPKNTECVIKAVKSVIKSHKECPDDRNFWEFWVNARGTRVATMHHEFLVMIQHLQVNGYYSKTFLPMLLNYRLSQRDGVRKADVVLTEDEVSYIIRKRYKLDTAENRAKQKSLDIFILALFTGARVADVRNVTKGYDPHGNAILMYHNHKGTRTQTVAWNEAVEGALERGLYKTQGKGSVIYAALKVALYESLPTSSNRIINYYYLRPGKGRELRADNRISHISFHTARHTFCTRLLRIGIGVHVVAQLAGHRSIMTTMKYYNWTKEQEANDILREVYGHKSLAAEKPEWGEGAKLNPIPLSVHQAMLPQARLGAVLPDDGGVVAVNTPKLVSKRPMSARRKAWIEKMKAKGVI